MSNVNLIMNNWKIPHTTTPINLGDSGENNAISISIKIDKRINFNNVKYYLDIMDKEVDGRGSIARTQEMELVEQTETIDGISVTTYFLNMKPTYDWLGDDGVKYLQVRCVYYDDIHNYDVYLESNCIMGVVNLGLSYKNTPIIIPSPEPIPQPYPQPPTVLPVPSEDNLGYIYQYRGVTDANYTNGYFYECVSDGEPIPTYSWVQKDVQPNSGGSSLQNVADAVVSGKSGGVLLNDTTNNVASSNYATAEGYYTTASGFASHAEGYETKASSSYSHAEGSNTTASGFESHAEGASTTASGWSSHAEGESTKASGKYSHAEGYGGTASGVSSHAQNEYTIAQGKSQTAIGKYNVAQGTTNSIANTDYAFIIGNGTDTNNRSDAFAIKWDGTIVFANGSELSPAEAANIITQVSTMPTASLDKLGRIYQYTGTTDANYTNGYFYECVSDGAITPTYSWVQKDVQPSGGGSSLINVIDSPTTGNTGGVVENAIREIENYVSPHGIITVVPNVASGDFSHAEGMGIKNNAGTFTTTASGLASHAEGKATQAIGEASHAEGITTTASGSASHTEGYTTTANALYSHAEGNRTTASGKEGSHAEGSRTTASGQASHAEGSETTASGSASHAEGNGTKASVSYSHAEGLKTTASGQVSHAEGSRTTAIGQASHAEGSGTTASGLYSHAEGMGTTASGDYSHAEGSYSVSSGYNSHASGNQTRAQGQNQTTIGKYNIPQGTVNSYVDTDYALIIGNGTSDTTEGRSNALAVQWDGNVVFQDGSKQKSAAISIADLKTLVASCSDFTDFKTQIASL